MCVTVYFSEFSLLALVCLELGSLGTLPQKTTLNNFANYHQNSMQIYMECNQVTSNSIKSERVAKLVTLYLRFMRQLCVVLINGYDERSPFVCTCTDHAGPLLTIQSGVPSHMHILCGPINAIVSSGNLSEPIRDWQLIVVFLHGHPPGSKGCWTHPKAPRELLSICDLICWWSGCTYISKVRPWESRTTRVTTRLLSVP